MSLNLSGKWLYVNPIGGVHVGADPPSGSTVLVAPGGTLAGDMVERYKVAELLEAPRKGGEHVERDAAGEPVVRREADGRAFAAGVLPPDDKGRKVAEAAAEKEDAAKAKAAKEDGDDEDEDEDEADETVKSKAVHKDEDDEIEDKAVVHRPKRGRPRASGR